MRISKILAFILAVVMLVCSVACSNQGTPANNGDNSSETNDTDNSDNSDTSDTSDKKEDENMSPPLTDKIVDLSTFIDSMSSSVYKLTDTVTEAKIGLSDSKNVGVDKDRFENEILYPVPADSEFAHIYKVSEHGISVDNENNSLVLNALLKSLKNVEGLKKIEFEPGVYKFDTTVIFEDIEDLYFCSSDPTESFEVLMTSWVPGIHVTDCDNIHFNSFSFDYEHPSVVTGTIASSSKNTCVIDIDDGYDLTHKSYNGGGFTAERYGSYMEFCYDEAEKQYIPDVNGTFLYNSTSKWNNAIKNGTYDADKNQLTLTFNDGRFNGATTGVKVNVAYTMYNYFGFKAEGGESIYVEDVTFYHTMGMAIYVKDTNNVYLNRFKLTPREGRLMTATADGFHSSDVRNIKITNCVLEYSHDDSFNIKNTYNVVTGVAAKKINLRASTTYAFEVGDELEFYEESTMASKGKYTITKVIDNSNSPVLQLDKIVDESVIGCLAANNTKATKLTLDNNVIGNKRNRGILLQTRESSITNNVFKNIVHGAVNLLAVRDEFKEGICPANVVIANNKFIGNNSADISILSWGSLGSKGGITMGLIEGIEITNNFFADCPTTSLKISACGKSSISCNLLYNTSLGENVMYGVSVDYCSEVEFKKNYFYSDVKSKMIPLEIGTNCSDITKSVNKFEKLN